MTFAEVVDVVEPVVGLTPERWDIVLAAMGIVVFCLGVMIAEKF